MKKKNRIYQALGICGMVLVLSGFAVLAANVGSSEDPLVTLSYLNDTYMEQILSKAEAQLDTRNEALKSQLEAQVKAAEQRLEAAAGAGGSHDSADTYVSVTLKKGQTLTGATGTEVLLRTGSATCSCVTAPALTDLTGGTSLNSGKSLQQNHLYLMPGEGVSVKAGTDNTSLLVRGDYVIG